MNLADYLDAYQTQQAQTSAPIAKRYTPVAPSSYTAQRAAPMSASPMSAPIPTPPAAMVFRPSAGGFAPIGPSMTVSPPPVTSLPSSTPPASTPPADAGTPFSIPTGSSAPSAPVYTQTAPIPDQQPTSSGGEASGDSGDTGSGFGWLLLAAGAYLVYRGMKT